MLNSGVRPWTLATPSKKTLNPLKGTSKHKKLEAEDPKSHRSFLKRAGGPQSPQRSQKDEGSGFEGFRVLGGLKSLGVSGFGGSGFEGFRVLGGLEGLGVSGFGGLGFGGFRGFGGFEEFRGLGVWGFRVWGF